MRTFGKLAWLSALLAVTYADSTPYCTPALQKPCPEPLTPSSCLTVSCGKMNSKGNAEFRDAMVDGHNQYRAKKIYGEYGANMLKMRWSDELEDNALRWADQLCELNTLDHDNKGCRKTPSFDSVGQNTFQGRKIDTDMAKSAKTAMDLWYSEKDKASLSVLNPFTFDLKYGHLSQMIWAHTFELGCGYVLSDSASYIVCNYAPTGNIKDANTFEPGSSVGFMCMEGSNQDSESGLCEPRDIATLRKTVALKDTKDAR